MGNLCIDGDVDKGHLDLTNALANEYKLARSSGKPVQSKKWLPTDFAKKIGYVASSTET